MLVSDAITLRDDRRVLGCLDLMAGLVSRPQIVQIITAADLSRLDMLNVPSLATLCLNASAAKMTNSSVRQEQLSALIA